MVFRFFKKNKKEQLEQKLLERLQPLAIPSLHVINANETTDSWLGGQPQVETTAFQWPMNDSSPMAFLAQLNLAEIQQSHHFDWLPATGYLLFFYDILSFAWGGDLGDETSYTVMYISDSAQPVALPESLEERFEQQYVSFTPHTSYPINQQIIEQYQLTPEEDQMYQGLVAASYGVGKAAHQISGHPLPVQGDDFPLQAHYISQGKAIDYDAGPDPDTTRVEIQEEDWQLLFQIDSCQQPEFAWGDAGCLYFWIKKADAQAGHFDKAVMFMACL